MNLYCDTNKQRKRQKALGHIQHLLLLLLMLVTEVTPAANLSREQRISERLEATISEGSPVWLEADSVRFLGIHRKTSATKRQGGVILLHDNSAHADWHEVINPLRRHLTDRGWDTLSIHIPITDDPSDPGAVRDLLASSLPRIQAAIDFHTEQQVDETALIGHGMGGRMAMSFIAQPGNRVGAAVVIGVPMVADDDQDPVFLALKGAQMPILDLYGSRDHFSVLDSAPLRRALAARSGQDRYRQVEVAGADHFFSGLQEELSNRVAAWLRQAMAQKPSNAQSEK
jgi:pimeloyl-ACP methyl ester carboxylesterase